MPMDTEMEARKIRVLVVDDSATVRQMLTDLLHSDPDIEVMGTAPDPYVAVQRIRESVPDVITLDIEMPRMDGLTFLEKIMNQHPIPVVICSSLTEQGSAAALEALDKGAVEVISKPKVGTRQFFLESATQICDVVKSAAQVRVGRRRAVPVPLDPVAKLTADAILERPLAGGVVESTERIVAVGASTGGTEALRDFIQVLPVETPGMVVVQHMPEHFTARFAERLDQLSEVSVKEAADGDPVVQGQVLIAPGNRHMLLKRGGGTYFVEIRDGPLVTRHRPSVDVLFRSVARYAGRNAVGILMTGMGDDGARGMLEMHQNGAVTIAQDEATCVVFGMPAEAIKLGGVDLVLPLPRIAPELLRLTGVGAAPLAGAG